MYLKSLEVQGFKSFPDKTLIRFGDDITAIVGPNGSGKSNISDAILWVMGEQSTKTLRGAKMEDVIFGGTQKRAAVGFAEATLTLDNTDRAVAYDADEVMITRRYYRSGDSEYYINRQSARLKDINELFMDTGMGREGYSNIGQGRIDEILALKSGDRREIFEEAAGISKYRHRKEETQRKLETTEDNLLRINDKVSELELQLEPLKIQSEKARKYLELKDELMGVEVAVWLDKLDRLSAEARKAEEDYASASFVLSQAHEDLDKLYEKSQKLGDDLRARDGDLENARIQLSMLEGAGQQMEGQKAVLLGNIENNRQNIVRIREELQGADDRSGGIVSQLEQTRQRIAEIGLAREQKQADIQNLQMQYAAMAENTQGLTRRYLELREREGAVTADMAGIRADMAGLEQSLREIAERKIQITQDLSSGRQRREEAGQQLEDCRKELKSAREEVLANQNAISGYTLRRQTREKRRDDLAGEAKAIQGELDGVCAKLNVFRAMERDYESFQKSVRTVMQEAQKGSLHHIRGPISRLIRTKDEYTVAVEIALGAATQHIVVDTEQDAKAAIVWLKRTGGGRATFLPVSNIKAKPLEEKGLENCAGFVGIASDLVETDDTYRTIVENLLGHTVIIENIDQAISMAKKYGNRFKIVTLDGQVMNPGGSMTGGSSGRETGILSRANELERLSAKEKALTEKLEKVQEQLGEAQRLVDQVQFQMETAAEQLRSAEDQVLRMQGREKQFEVLYRAIADAEGSAEKELASLCNREGTDGSRMTSQQAKLQMLEQELTRIAAGLQALEVSQNEATAAGESLTEQLTNLRTQEAALAAEGETAKLHVQEMEHLCAAMEGDRTQKLALIQSIEEDIARLESQLDALKQQQSDNAADVIAAKESRDGVLKCRADTEAEKTAAERKAQEKNKDLLNMERACALLENKKETTAIEEKNIIDKLWDTYELTPNTAAEKRGSISSAADGNRRIAELKRKIGALGTPNVGAIEEYARVNERYTYLTGQRDDVETSKRELEGIIREITKEMTAIFVTEFAKINGYFGETFEEMFGGGKGELVLEDPEEPLTCGIEIRVQPPGKQLKTITLLSGGEKAFVAIALYFAILKVRPTPFCMLDEIDAALDDRNVERYAHYMHSLSKKTQFIVITHRRGTMEASDVLYGVTMQEQGVSKLLRLDLNQMEQQLGIAE